MWVLTVYAPLWVLKFYYVTALIGSVLIVFVMLKTEKDRINRIDPAWVKNARRGAFAAVDLALLWTVIDQAKQVPLSFIVVVEIALILLVINAFALHFRVPPDVNAKRYAVPAFVRRWLPRGVRH